MSPSSIKSSPPRSVLTGGLFIGILAASTASIFIRLAQGEGVPSLVIAAARLTIASLVLAPFALTRYRSELRSLTRREWIPGLLSGLFLAFHFASWITSLQYTTVASSVVLVTTTPLWVALLSPLVLREKITPMILVGMLLALLGGGIVAVSDSCTLSAGKLICPPMSEFLRGSAFLGNFLAVFGAWMAAGYILIGRRVRAKMSLIPYIFVVYGMAAVVLVAIMFCMGKSPVGYSPVAYLWFVLLALIPQLLGHTSFNWALGYLPASFVSVILLGEPIGSTILAILILGEMPGWIKIGGAVLILAGIYLAARGDKG
jgi:drug/metabolite transporter (DMT)-like permease